MRAKLQRTREAYGFTQQQFADAIGISRSHYSQIETGDKTPSFDLARKIKGMLDYPGDDLFDEKPTTPGKRKSNTWSVAHPLHQLYHREEMK